MFVSSEAYTDNRYKAIIENMIDAFVYYKVVFDENNTPVDFEYIDVNQSFETLTGLKREDIINKKLTEVFPDIEDMDANWLHSAIRAALNGESIKYNTYFRPFNKWLSCSLFSYEYGYFAEIFHDITAEKLSAEKVKKSEEVMHLALDGVGDGVWDWNLYSNKITYSQTYKGILGFNPEELPTDWQSWISSLHPDDVELTKKDMLEHINGSTSSFRIEFRFKCRDGSYKWLLSRGKVTQYTRDGKPVRITGTHADISLRKSIERALKENEEKYRSIYNSVQDAIFIADVETGNILEANPAACSLYGYTKEEILKMNRADFVVDVEKMLENIEQKLEHLSIYQKKKDGSVFPTDIRISEGVYDQKQVRIIVVRDITNHKLVEDLKKEIEKNLLIINESKIYESLRTDFFANISHELRTPINVIFGSVQLINLYLADESSLQDIDKYKRYSRIIHQNCFRLLRLVNNLIDITKIDAGYLEVNLENKNIVSIIEDITLSVSDYIENKDIGLIFDTDSEEIFIAVDSDMIERIMLNLLSNSIKFTKPGGAIYVNLKQENTNLIISVKDTGIGIPEDKLDKIFDRFMQVDKSLARSNEGSGIGLSLVKSLVELHSGRIKVISKLGEGCEFTITLPIMLTYTAEMVQPREEGMNQNYVERINIEFSDIYS